MGESELACRHERSVSRKRDVEYERVGSDRAVGKFKAGREWWVSELPFYYVKGSSDNQPTLNQACQMSDIPTSVETIE